MAIDQIGVPASVPQQFEQLITSSTNWSVPAGVKTVECIIAGGGSNNRARGGVFKGLYNVQGKTSIPITVGAAATTNGVRGGTTSFDNRIVAYGGVYVSDTSIVNGNLIDFAIHPASDITNGTPVAARTAFSNGTTARMRYFAAFNGRGIAISNDGTVAMTTTNSGATWTPVTSITGAASSFVNIISERSMLLHHNGGLWLVFSHDSNWYAYSENGTAWVTVNFGTSIRDMIAMGASTSREAVIVTGSAHLYTSNITTTAFTTALSSRGDVLFRESNTNVYSFDGSRNDYRYSTNGGASWTSSSFASLPVPNRWVKTYTNSTSQGVIVQRGLNSNTFSIMERTGSADQIRFFNFNVNSSGGGSANTPQNSGDNNTTLTVHIWRPQTFDQNDFGISGAWTKNGTMVHATPSYNYSWLNTGDGTLVGTNFNSPFLGGNFVYDVSEYVIGQFTPFRSIFTDNAREDGFIYAASGYVGQGVAAGSIQSNFVQIPADALGHNSTASFGSSNPADIRVFGGGIEGWGRTSNLMPGLGFGGSQQNGAVLLRWWA